MWANLRCLWINFVRIANFVAASSPDYAQNIRNQWITSRFCAQLAEITLFTTRFLQFPEKMVDKFSGNFGVLKNTLVLTKYMLILNL
jgi:hypothetical protein